MTELLSHAFQVQPRGETPLAAGLVVGTPVTSVADTNALPSALYVWGPVWSQQLPWLWTPLLPLHVREQNEAQGSHLTAKTTEPRL